MVQWAEEEVERELAEMTEREGGGGGEGGGEWVFGSWFIEGARAFKHKKCRRGRYLLLRNCNECWPKGLGQLSCSRGGRGGGVWWEGEVCRSGEGMWDSAGNGTVRWHV